jgi:surface polysaccharide O-acyltransferase-like enzyme
LWMTGIIPLVLLVAYHLQEWEKLPLWLLNFGRNALLIYAIHRLFIVAIMQNLFHFELGSISGFIVVNLALLFVLNELARLVNQLRALRVSHAQTDGV